MIVYEQLLDQNPRRALQEGSLHFEKGSAVHETLRKITRKLDDLGIRLMQGEPCLLLVATLHPRPCRDTLKG